MLPVILDFSVPRSRDVTETVKVLAGLARFVIADVTDATEVRAELHNLVPDFTSLPVQPILLRGQREFVSLPHLARFPWLLPTFEYDSKEHLLALLGAAERVERIGAVTRAETRLCVQRPAVVATGPLAGGTPAGWTRTTDLLIHSQCQAIEIFAPGFKQTGRRSRATKRG